MYSLYSIKTVIFAFTARCKKLNIMLAKCMLLISLVENTGFREFINYFDPSFRIPTRYTIKKAGLPSLKAFVDDKNREILANVPWVNVSCDAQWARMLKNSRLGVKTLILALYTNFKMLISNF